MSNHPSWHWGTTPEAGIKISVVAPVALTVLVSASDLDAMVAARDLMVTVGHATRPGAEGGAVNTTVDPDLVRAIAWCRLGGREYRPHDDGAFHRAKRMGLLAQDPIWRATAQGEGVLVALGMLDGGPEPEWVEMIALWCREPREGAPAQFIGTLPAGLKECWPERFEQDRAEMRRRFCALLDPGTPMLFFDTVERVKRP